LERNFSKGFRCTGGSPSSGGGSPRIAPRQQDPGTSLRNKGKERLSIILTQASFFPHNAPQKKPAAHFGGAQKEAAS